MIIQNVLVILRTYNINIDLYSGCWHYSGKQKGRYPRVSYNGIKYQLHRLAWILANEMNIPENKYICHKCDNTKCCNPDHLFLGTQFDNMRDMISKGRNYDTSGENNGRANLSWELVNQIRHENLSGLYKSDIAKRHNLPISTINNITQNKTWKDPSYIVPPIKHKNYKVNPDLISNIVMFRNSDYSQDIIAKKVGVSQALVSRVLRKYLSGSTE